MKIIAYYVHSTRFAQMAQLPHEYYFWRNDGSTWDEKYSTEWGWIPPKPYNVHFVNENHSERYDVGIVGTEVQAEHLRGCYPDMPIIASCGDTIRDQYNGIVDAVVGLSKRNIQYCNHPNKYVIYPGIDDKLFNGYKGTIEKFLCVANLPERVELRRGMAVAVANSPNFVTIGIGSETVRGGLGFIEPELVVKYMQDYRAFIYTANALCGICNAVCQAAMVGMPLILGDFADWKELIANGVNGYVSDDILELYKFAVKCITSIDFALEVSVKTREMALKYFNTKRFASDWDVVLSNIRR